MGEANTRLWQSLLHLSGYGYLARTGQSQVFSFLKSRSAAVVAGILVSRKKILTV
jgi:hypothetical protein